MTVQKPFLDPQKQVDLAVADLGRRIPLEGIITKVDGDAFGGTVGTGDNEGKGIVYVETEAVTVARDYEWRTRKNPIQYDDIFRSKHPIIIDQHITQGARWNPEEVYVDEVKFGKDILPPATKALARKINSKIELALTAVGASSDMRITDLTLGLLGDHKGEEVLRQVLRMNARATEAGMPKEGRKLIAGANAYIHIAASSALVRYSIADAKSVYKQGVIGVIDNTEIVNGSGFIGENEFYLLHPSWLIVPSEAGDLPTSGVSTAVKASVDGWAARLIRGYSMDYDREGSVFHTYLGINVLKDELDRHTKQSAATAADGSLPGDPKVVDGKLVVTGKTVRIAKGTFVPGTAPE